jgi:hypothetical protein
MQYDGVCNLQALQSITGSPAVCLRDATISCELQINQLQNVAVLENAASDVVP